MCKLVLVWEHLELATGAAREVRASDERVIAILGQFLYFHKVRDRVRGFRELSNHLCDDSVARCCEGYNIDVSRV